MEGKKGEGKTCKIRLLIELKKDWKAVKKQIPGAWTVRLKVN